MKMPATTEGVPLMAVTTVRTSLRPATAHLVEEDGGGDGQRYPHERRRSSTCSRVPMMAWGMPTWSRTLGSAGYEVASGPW